VLGGVVQSLHDDVVLLREGDGLDQLVHLVPHLGGGQVVVGSHGGLAGSPGHAVELALISAGVEEETHPSGQVSLGHRGGGLARPSSHSAAADQAEHHDGNLESDEDDEVGQVQREDLAAGGGSGDDLKSCLQQGGAFRSSQS
jgi:hypothetical protein